MTCDDYQIAFEQRQAGASIAISAVELDAHVATCAACTAYVSLSQKVSASMTTTLAQTPAPPDYDAILKRITKLRREMTRSVKVFALVLFVMFMAQRFDEHGFGLRALSGALIGGAAAYGFSYLVSRRRIAALKALESQSGEPLVVGLRAELDKRIRIERRDSWALPLILAVFQVTAVGAAVPSPPELLLELALLAVLPFSIVRYRRLARERAVLGA